jgi:uncharacterized phage protein gp47/JayE
MAYFSPYIDSSGLHIPTYIDIRDQLILDAKNTFGADIYLGNDSQDYQWIAVIAEKIYDSFQLAQMVYNDKSPISAIGISLDSLVKLNGITRNSAIYSTCLVVVTGVSGTVITNGIVVDTSNTSWSLPASVTIPIAGHIEVLATCQIEGPIVANIGDINQIGTPTYGWTSVINNSAATIGSYTETDAQLRARQAVSTALSSRSLLEATKGEIAAIDAVTRYQVYENDTNIVDADGLPAHSITCVVEGGIAVNIAQAIFDNKGIGCYTNGTTTVNVTDDYGQVTPIRFSIPDYVDMDIVVNVKALSGYTSEITDLIKDNLAEYLDGLQIGEDVTISSLWGIALTAMPDLKTPLFSVTSLTAARHGGVQGTADIVIDYDEVTRGNISYITVNVS